MARTTERLTALKVQRAKRSGMYPDGHGLYLQVTEGGASWVYRFMLNGRAREMGLGPLHTITLAEARERATRARKLRLDGVDPIEQRRSEQAAQRVAGATAMSFRQCADAFIASHEAGWGSAVHRRQWTNSLAQHVHPVIGALPAHAIDTTLVRKVIEPLWGSIPETASRIRGRVEAILDWAKVRGYRAGENPARWRGHLDKLLPARGKVRKVEHHAALHYGELPGFMAALREQEGIAARALEFTILTATRVGETRFARWSELDLLDETWTVPSRRMKSGREHRVPLSARVLAILEAMQVHRHLDRHVDDGFVFPGSKVGRPLADTVLLRLLQRMGRGDLTVHGFRSTFRDWAAERTNFPSEVAEMALAHSVGSKVEAAYRRGDLFDKRRRLMEAWAEYCAKTPSEKGSVIALRAG
jgi:integrase